MSTKTIEQPEFTIDYIIFQDFNFKQHNPYINGEKLCLTQEVNYSLESNDDNKNEKIFPLTINIKTYYESQDDTLNDNNIIFSFDINMIGKFTFYNEFKEKICSNIIAIMYSYIRPMIAQFTTLGGLPPLNIPPVNFTKIKLNK